MHDPMTVAFEIKYPWRKYPRRSKSPYETDFSYEFDQSYRESFITIWHVDPELHGSDDSCGWFTPPLSKEIKDICKTLAGDESHEPWFLLATTRQIEDPILCERLLFGAFILLSQCLVNRKVIRRPVSVNDATRWASIATHNSIDNFRSSLSFKSGYHSNWYSDGIPNTIEQDKYWREEQARSFFLSIAGWILRERRHWYRKPRWHFWHWKLQIHPLQLIMCWLFERCTKCGGRYAYRESPCGSWSGKETWHMDCDDSRVNQGQEAKINNGKV